MLKKLCRKAGCSNYRLEGHNYCEKHLYLEEEDKKRHEDYLSRKYQHREMPDEKARLYRSARWKKESKEFLQENRICCLCGIEEATQVHHDIDPSIPYWEDEELFFDKRYWRPVCLRCHSTETSRRMDEKNRRIKKLWY